MAKGRMTKPIRHSIFSPIFFKKQFAILSFTSIKYFLYFIFCKLLNYWIKRPPPWRFLLILNEIQQRCDKDIAKIKVQAPGELPRLQRPKHRLLNEMSLRSRNSYDTKF
jgi:hypothetical protein